MDAILLEVLIAGIVLLAIWSFFWKAWALWIAGNRKEKTWFIILLVLNTAGILDIAYLVSRKRAKK